MSLQKTFFFFFVFPKGTTKKREMQNKSIKNESRFCFEKEKQSVLFFQNVTSKKKFFFKNKRKMSMSLILAQNER